MKKTIKYIVLLTIAGVFGACEDFLELTPEDRLVADEYYRTEEEVRSGTASLYGYPWFNFNDKFFWLAGDCMSGNIYYTYDQEGQYYYLSFNAGNSYLSEGWKGLFRVVSYTNSVINDMPRIALENVSEEIVNQALAEARFIRAMAYYILAEFWGEVPIVENSTELVVTNDMMLPKNTRSSLYEFIRRDLEFVIENVKPDENEPGRVTKWSAEGLMAKLYLTMAQDLTDPNSGQYFDLAKQYAQDVIENSGLTLMPVYGDLFKIENDNNSESLFAMQWIKAGYATGNSRNANWARSSVIADQQWGGGKSCTYDLLQIIEPGDLRRKEIYMTLGDEYPELNQEDGGYTYYFEVPDPENPTNNIESPNDVLNHLKKYVIGKSSDVNGQVGIDQDAANNVYLLRLADVYLIYAEATLGAGTETTDETALGYFNAIRERAGLDPKTNLTFLDIFNERRVEFALESMFWFDIKRYYYRNSSAAIEYINSQKRHYVYRRIDGTEDANTWDSYQLDSTLNSAIVVYETDMFLPIPEAEVIINPLFLEDAVDYQFE
ncbi:MAG: RagB/SusD family nutrient uptake outer membrane protein [Bacteroidales bacterium]|nr:RagB/SusD family nutrient uptake outer membrane protein [Bacteroidales bacterium]